VFVVNKETGKGVGFTITGSNGASSVIAIPSLRHCDRIRCIISFYLAQLIVTTYRAHTMNTPIAVKLYDGFAEDLLGAGLLVLKGDGPHWRLMRSPGTKPAEFCIRAFPLGDAGDSILLTHDYEEEGLKVVIRKCLLFRSRKAALAIAKQLICLGYGTTV
jgi:hypothetical protein